jgi:methionyl aminopeptidase
LKGDGPTSNNSSSAGGEPRGAHHSRDGDGGLGDDGDEDGDGDGDNDHVGSVSLTVDGDKKKKKRKLKKKKKKAPTAQSSPPRVPLDNLFRPGEFPTGQFMEYFEERTTRTTAEELRYRSRQQLEDPAFLDNYRKAAEVHRQVRHWVRENAKPGMTLNTIATEIEDGIRALLDNQGLEPGDYLKAGMGFPTGLCLNNQVAHYTPNPGQKDVVLQHSDVMKVDFGVQIGGWIVDSAFTMAFDPTYNNLLAAVKDATNTGIKVRMNTVLPCVC